MPYVLRDLIGDRAPIEERSHFEKGLIVASVPASDEDDTSVLTEALNPVALSYA